MNLEEMAARLEILDVLYRYCRGVDRGDAALIRSVYHADATDDHGSFKGPGHEFADVIVKRMDGTGIIGQHHVTNVLIERNGDSARVESYFIAFNPERHPQTDEPMLSQVIGRYLDRFEKRNGQWKIADRKVVIDQAAQGAALPPWPRISAFSTGGRREKDPSHGFFSFGAR